MQNINIKFSKLFSRIIYYISFPVTSEFAFFITSIFLQVLPIIICSYYNYGGIFQITTALNNSKVCSIPYILYFPFFLSYFFCVCLVILKRKSYKIYNIIKVLVLIILI